MRGARTSAAPRGERSSPSPEEQAEPCLGSRGNAGQERRRGTRAGRPERPRQKRQPQSRCSRAPSPVALGRKRAAKLALRLAQETRAVDLRRALCPHLLPWPPSCMMSTGCTAGEWASSRLARAARDPEEISPERPPASSFPTSWDATRRTAEAAPLAGGPLAALLRARPCRKHENASSSWGPGAAASIGRGLTRAREVVLVTWCATPIRSLLLSEKLSHG